MFRNRKLGFITSGLVFSLVHTSVALAAYDNYRVTSNFQDRDAFLASIDDFDARERDLNAVLVTPTGQWMVISGAEIDRSSAFSSAMASSIQTKLNAGRRVVAGDCSESDACVVVYDDWSTTTRNTVPSCVASIVGDYEDEGWVIRDIEITDNACLILGTGNLATYSTSLDPELQRAVYDRRASGRSIDSVTVGFNQEWALVAGHNPMYSGIPDRLVTRLQTQAKDTERKADTLVLGVNGDYLWYSGHNDSTSTASQIGAIEYDLGPSQTTNIWTRMEELGVTGASVALITNTSEGPAVSTARGYGNRRADADLPILARTPFSLASLSKYLGAVVVADQIEGDSQVSRNTNLLTTAALPASGALKTWVSVGQDGTSAFRESLPATMGGGSPVATLSSFTLNTLMTHTARIVSEDDGSSLVRKGLWSANNSRATVDWLYGRQCSSASCSTYGNSVWQINTPALTYDYDSANYLVAQAYIEDRTGVSAHTNLTNRLFTPVGMPDSSSRINLGTALQSEIAWKHSTAGTPDADMANSAWVFGGGTFASSVDYANAMIVALNQGLAANGTRVLEAATVNDLFLAEPSGNPVRRGWGVDFDRSVSSIGEGTDEAFRHGGSQGGTRTAMCGNPTDNEGIVVLVNLGGDNAQQLIDEILAAYVKRVSWKAGSDCK
jgi:CubicO group peptidase (beta-lactamase class C family)